MIEVYTDGAAAGDPGPSAAGVFIKNGKDHREFSFTLGEMSNHEAEFWAVIRALEVCQKYFPDEILSFRSDSKIVVETIEKNYTKNSNFISLLEKINQLQSGFPYVFFKWIPEKQNGKADALARTALKK
ncbi:ribonuclease H [Thalassobacillus devorans]|uniref:Ribonuclease H n=1 Tax=Thalassobacillus devorans TaxID=279813 RepID=A0ABQ1NZZ3_9BACI|nr:ribonuclease HI family protein [Thalassobacillus devorans]NIK28248.1 ribonuclease HI [Thalassobacillus devorans]GGC87716.1 ribonuclease H [Thalassobacillus devorans]